MKQNAKTQEQVKDIIKTMIDGNYMVVTKYSVYNRLVYVHYSVYCKDDDEICVAYPKNDEIKGEEAIAIARAEGYYSSLPKNWGVDKDGEPLENTIYHIDSYSSKEELIQEGWFFDVSKLRWQDE